MESYLNQKVLSILIYKDGFSYAVIRGKDIILHNQVEFPTGTTYFEGFKLAFESQVFSSDDFDFVDVCFLNPHFSLVPNDAFEENLSSSFFTGVSQFSPMEGIRYNYIPYTNSILLYQYSEEIEYYLNQKFDVVRFIHSGFRTISKFFISNGEGLLLNAQGNRVEFLLKINGIFQYYNVFEYQTEKDILYYLSLIMAQFQPNDFPLCITESSTDALDLQVYLSKFYPTIALWENSNHYSLIED